MKRGGPINQFHHVPGSACVSRPCRIPTAQEASTALTRDLSRTTWVVQSEKMGQLRGLPLLEVALDGHEGVLTAARHAAGRKAT